MSKTFHLFEITLKKVYSTIFLIQQNPSNNPRFSVENLKRFKHAGTCLTTPTKVGSLSFFLPDLSIFVHKMKMIHQLLLKVMLMVIVLWNG